MTEQIQNDSGGRTAAGPASVASLEQLVAIRQAAGLGASDIASRMGMATRQIEALERGDWGRLPGQAFVRAALRAYGKSLDVDVGPLLATIGGQATGGVPELKAAASLESPIPRAGGSGFGLGGRLGWIVLGLAAVIAIVFYFGPAFEHKESGQTEAPAATGSADSAGPEAGVRSSGSGSGTPAAAAGAGIVAGGGAAPATQASAVATTPTIPAVSGPSGPGPDGAAANAGTAVRALAPFVPLTSAIAPEIAATGAAGQGTSTAASPAVTGAGASGLTGAATAAPAAASADATPSAAPGSETIRLRFGRESWVEIREAGGRVLLTGLQPAGSERTLSGRRPLALVIGNAEHVTLERGGAVVDLRGRIRQGVARLTLD